MRLFEPTVYLLCFLTSLGAMLLLLRSYLQNRSRLLLWSALAFVALACNNLLLFVDIVLLPDLDLRPLRLLTAFLAVATLLYAFIWEVD
jgi:hypothetical protein